MATPFAVSLAKETWTLYAVGIAIIALRFVARLRRNGVRKLLADDVIMLQGTIWYTLLCVSLNEVASGGGSNLMTPEDIAALTPETTADRVAGSKWVFVSEQVMLLTVWSMKVCMLLIYNRMTRGTPQEKVVFWVAVWLVLGFIGSQLALFLTCRPFHQYWAVPTSNDQCATYQHYEIIQACFHVTGDVAMLCLGIPIIINTQLPFRQKLILTGVFGMGIFVFIAAVLDKLYCLVPSLISYVYMNWYFREASVSVYVTNLPFLWSLIHELCPGIASWARSSGTQANAVKYISPISDDAKAIPLPSPRSRFFGENRTNTVVVTTTAAKHIGSNDPTKYPHVSSAIRHEHKTSISGFSASQNHSYGLSESQEYIRNPRAESVFSNSRQSSVVDSWRSTPSAWTIRQDITFAVETSPAHKGAVDEKDATVATTRAQSSEWPSMDSS